MDEIRKIIRDFDNKTLLEMWEEIAKNTENYEIAICAIIETELENRGLISLNEDTFEYEVL